MVDRSDLRRRATMLNLEIIRLGFEQLRAPTYERLRVLDDLMTEGELLEGELRGVEASGWRAVPGKPRGRFRVEREQGELWLRFQLGRDDLWRSLNREPFQFARSDGAPTATIDLDEVADAVEGGARMSGNALFPPPFRGARDG